MGTHTHTYPKSACIDESATAPRGIPGQTPSDRPAWSTTCQNGMPSDLFQRPHQATQVANVASACAVLETGRALSERNLCPDVTTAHNSRSTHGNLGIVAAVLPLADSDFQSSRQTDVGRVSCGPDCDPRPDLTWL